MSEIKLKTEGLPKRCDICHQADLFDKLNNYCERCKNLALSYQSQAQNILFRQTYWFEQIQTFVIKELSLSIGQICALTIMISSPLIGIFLFCLINAGLDELLSAFNISKIAIPKIFGAVTGFLLLIPIAKLFSKKTSMKLAEFIDFKIELFIKKKLSKTN